MENIIININNIIIENGLSKTNNFSLFMKNWGIRNKFRSKKPVAWVPNKYKKKEPIGLLEISIANDNQGKPYQKLAINISVIIKNNGIQNILNEKFLVYLNRIKTKPKIKEIKKIKKEEKKA